MSHSHAPPYWISCAYCSHVNKYSGSISACQVRLQPDSVTYYMRMHSTIVNRILHNLHLLLKCTSWAKEECIFQYCQTKAPFSIFSYKKPNFSFGRNVSHSRLRHMDRQEWTINAELFFCFFFNQTDQIINNILYWRRGGELWCWHSPAPPVQEPAGLILCYEKSTGVRLVVRQVNSCRDTVTNDTCCRMQK